MVFPASVEVVVHTFSVEEPPPLIELGLKLPLAPGGNPLKLRFIVPLNPVDALTVLLVHPPATTGGKAVVDKEKSGGGVWPVPTSAAVSEPLAPFA
jgi:hypothetical protein